VIQYLLYIYIILNDNPDYIYSYEVFGFTPQLCSKMQHISLPELINTMEFKLSLKKFYDMIVNID